jgi:hypothetical protein
MQASFKDHQCLVTSQTTFPNVHKLNPWLKVSHWHDLVINEVFLFPLRFSTSDFSNNKFIKQQQVHLNIKNLNLFTIPKLTCIQIAKSFKKTSLKTNFFYDSSKWKKNTKSKI